MHKSRLAGFIIDCRTDDLDREALFWSAALGRRAVRIDTPQERNYRTLATDPAEPYMQLQRVEHPSRVHLDIETDDVEAEVRRLEALGARRASAVRDWWVMEAPSGHRFCVVPAQSADFDARANVWA
jgi:predicted enzyme related to lactoylglutathione lyase